MRVGLYTVAALVLLALMAAFVYTQMPGYHTLEFFGVNITLPVVVWVMLPALLLFLFSLLHLLIYGFKSYLQERRWQRDAATLDDALYWSLVKEPKEQHYSVPAIEDSAMLLNKASLELTEYVEGLNPRLAKIATLILKIKNGEYVDLKAEKLGKVFADGNPYLIQNRLNRLDSDEKFIEEVIKSSTSFSDPVRQKALSLFVQRADFPKARAFAKLFGVEHFMQMIRRAANAEEKLGLTPDICTHFVESLPMQCRDFMLLAKELKGIFDPDTTLSLFKRYQKENEKAQSAYLYLLFEYELSEEAKAYLDEQGETEFAKFRAYLALKEAGYHASFEALFEPETLCK